MSWNPPTQSSNNVKCFDIHQMQGDLIAKVHWHMYLIISFKNVFSCDYFIYPSSFWEWIKRIRENNNK